MRPHSWRIARYRRTLPLYADDHAAHTDRVSESRIKIHADSARRTIATGCYGFVAQAGERPASVGSLVFIVMSTEVETSLTISDLVSAGNI